MSVTKVFSGRSARQGSLLVLVMLGLPYGAGAQTVVVPNAYSATEGEFGLSTVVNSNARTLQMIISASQLTAIPLNYQISGLAFRLNAGQLTSPGFPVMFANYDIYMGQAGVSPLGASNAFLSNYATPAARQQVRSGALSLDSSFFPNSGTTPNAFSADIVFNLGGLIYQGGDLVVEITHTGNGGANFAIDATANSTAAAAYASNGYNALTNTGINVQGATLLVPIVQFRALAPAPEPGVLYLVSIGGIALFLRRRR